MALDDRNYWRQKYDSDNGRVRDNTDSLYESFSKSEQELKYEDYLKDSGIIHDDGYRHFPPEASKVFEPSFDSPAVEPSPCNDSSLNIPEVVDPVYPKLDNLDLKNTKFDSDTGELLLDNSSKVSSQPIAAYTPSPRSPSNYEQYKLHQKQRKQVKPAKPFPMWVAWLFVVTVVLSLYSLVGDFKPSFPSIPPLKSNPTPTPVPTPAPTPHIEAPLPPTASLRSYYILNNKMPPFAFSVPAGSEHYAFKLKDVNTQKVVLFGFCRSGETLKTFVPFGNYHLDYASGKNWQNESELFGSSTVVRRASKSLDFYSTGSRLMGHTISMQKRVDGNLHSDYIPQSRF